MLEKDEDLNIYGTPQLDIRAWTKTKGHTLHVFGSDKDTGIFQSTYERFIVEFLEAKTVWNASPNAHFSCKDCFKTQINGYRLGHIHKKDTIRHADILNGVHYEIAMKVRTVISA